MIVFHLTVNKYIRAYVGSSSSDAHLTLEFDLPFAPYPGLLLVYQDESLTTEYAVTLGEVVYHVTGGHFDAYAPDVDSWLNEGTVAEQAALWVEEGWTLQQKKGAPVDGS